MAVGGYVDKGFFLNFGGPNLNVSIKNPKFLMGPFGSKRTRGHLKMLLLPLLWVLDLLICTKALPFNCRFTTIQKRLRKMGDWFWHRV
jgi:hypothetical protein